MTYEEDIRKAVETLRKGGVILYPTDTIWGIGCDATNAEAVERIYQIKRRSDAKAMLCLVDSDTRLQRYARNLSDVAWDLLTLPTTPTTVVLDGVWGLAENLYAEDGSLGIRITHEEFSKKLCYTFEKPIVSTSANVSGEPPAQNYEDISPEILSAVDYICFARRNEHMPHKPSSIVKLSGDGIVKIIRR